MFSDEGGVGIPSLRVRRTRSRWGDFARMAACDVGGDVRLAFRAFLAFALGAEVGRALGAEADRLAEADLVVGRLAERLSDRRPAGARVGFLRRLPLGLAIARPFGTLTVCR